MTESGFTRRVMDMRDQLYHVARSLLWNDEDAEDAVQEAMLRAWKKRGALRDEARFEAWFMRIFINQCRDMQRGQIRRRAAVSDIQSRPEELPPEAAGDVGEALDELPDELRLPTILFYIEGYSQGEIARILGIGAEQVNTRLRRARRRMRRTLAEGGGGDE